MPIRNDDPTTTTGEMKAMRDDIRSMENRILHELGRSGGAVGDPPSSVPVDKRPPRRGKRH